MPRLTKNYKEHLFERLQAPEEVAAYLNAAMEDGDVALVLLALRDVAEAWGVGKVAAEAELNRENVYRILSARGNPRLSSFIRLLHALGIELRVQVARDGRRRARAATVGAASTFTPTLLGGRPDEPEQFKPVPEQNRGHDYESSFPTSNEPLAA